MGVYTAFLLFCVLLRSLKAQKVSTEDDPCILKGQKGLYISLCSQICIPTNRTYVCQCLHGYSLSDNEHSCDVNGDEEPGLFYVAKNKIQVYFLEQRSSQVLYNGAGTVADFAFGPDRSLYWIDSQTQSVSMLQFDEMFKVNSVESVVDSGLTSPNAIALDPSTSTLYIVDSKPGEIIVCTLKGDYCTILLRNLTNPQDIVVDSSKRMMYWSEWGGKDIEGSIHSAGTDGIGSHTLASDLQSPRNLVLDSVSGILFWLAETLDNHVIQMMKLYSHNIVQDIVTFQSYHNSPYLFMSMSRMFIQEQDNILTWIETNKRMQGLPLVADKHIDGPIKLYYPEQHQYNRKDNMCATSQCSHLCVHSHSNQSYRCLCPLDMELSSEDTCTKKDQSIRFLTAGTKKEGIYEVPLDFIGQSSYRAQQMVGGDIGSFTYGPTNQIVVFYDDHHKTIEVIDIKRTNRHRTVLYRRVSRIEGIALDEESGYLFWTTGQGRVIRAQLDGARQEIILEGLDKPRGIAFDRESRMLYVSDWGRIAKILQCNTTQTTVCEVMLNLHLGHPNHLVVSNIEMHGHRQSVLMWTDSKLDTIGLRPLNNNSSTQEMITLGHIRNVHPFAIAVSGRTIYCTDLNNEMIHYIDLDTHTSRQCINLRLGSLFNLAIFTYRDNPLPPSKDMNITSPPYREPVSVSSVPHPETDNFLWVVFLVLGLLFVALIGMTAAYLYYRNQQKKNWMRGIIKYLKKYPQEDSERLMNHNSTSRPSFLNFDDLDYPECDRLRRDLDKRMNIPSGDFSYVSMDSAFTELQDFSNSSGSASP